MLSGTIRDSLAWAGTLAVGTWLSMGLAHWMADALASSGGGRGSLGPMREIVEEVLHEHRAEDTPMVHAFETALETNGSGATA